MLIMFRDLQGGVRPFFCVTCDTRGELNSDGFRVELTEKKEDEPQEEEPKPKQRKEIKK